MVLPLARSPVGQRAQRCLTFETGMQLGCPQALTPRLCGHGRDPGRSWLAQLGLINICGFSLDGGSSQEHLGWAGENRLPRMEAEMGWRLRRFPCSTGNTQRWSEGVQAHMSQMHLLGFPDVAGDGVGPAWTPDGGRLCLSSELGALQTS